MNSVRGEVRHIDDITTSKSLKSIQLISGAYFTHKLYNYEQREMLGLLTCTNYMAA